MPALPTYFKKMRLNPAKQLALFFAIWVSLLPAKSEAVAVALGCSTTQQGKAVINEINTSSNNNFIEVYLLSEADISSWSIYLDEALVQNLGKGNCTVNGVVTPDNGAIFPAGTFIFCYQGSNVIPAKGEVLLLDKIGMPSGATVIDYLGYGGIDPDAFWEVPSECGTLYPEHDANEKDIARIPDGTASLLDNNEGSTPGTSNDGGGGGGTIIANDFNCIEPVTLSENANIKQVYTKIAGRDFILNIVAIKNDGTIDTNYNQEVTVDIIDPNNPTTIIRTQSLTFTNNVDNGKKPVTFNIDHAYKNLVCRVTRAQGANPIVEISDNFSVRPSKFTITAEKIDGTTLNNATANGTPKEIAGTDFKLIATTNVVNYDGTPVIDHAGFSSNPVPFNTAITPHAVTTPLAMLGGVSFGQAIPAPALPTSSKATGTFTYSEVGNFIIKPDGVVDSRYTLIDQFTGCVKDSASNTADAGKYGCNIANIASDPIGRFIPDHFKVISNMQGTFGNECVATGGAGVFTYTGQEFTYDVHPSLTLAAYNSDGGITQNYTGDYMKLALNDFIITEPVTDKDELGADGAANVRLNWVQDVDPTMLVDNTNGTITFTLREDTYEYNHETNSIISPFIPEVELTFTDLEDEDGVEAMKDDPITPYNLISDVPYTLTPTESEMRFGRLTMDNVHGSELTALNSPVYTEYFNNSGFVTNTEDSCTAINLSQFSFNGGVNPIAVAGGSSTASIANIPVSAGQVGLSFTAPGAGNTGFIDISMNSLFAWLKFDWDGDGNHDNTPTARATFGIYKGNQKQIYFREVY